ncbi:hypothetical protein EIP86_004579 [Pleurotus ostreatoroseus]|nr:hypothetical protein EIP86_004579 [Pleurotus ostreatoroseus]
MKQTPPRPSSNLALRFGTVEKERKCETCSASNLNPGVELRSCGTLRPVLLERMPEGKLEAINDPQVNPDGLKPDALSSHLKSWKKCHEVNFMVSCLHALGVHRDFDRIKTHFLHVKVCARPASEHKGLKEKYFRVVDATVVADKDTPWPQLKEPDQLPALRREEEESGRGSLAVVVLDCPGLRPSVLQFGSIRREDVSGQIMVPWWKEILITNVLDGDTKNMAKAVSVYTP